MIADSPGTPGFETMTEAGPEAPWLTMVHGMSQDRRVFSAQVADFKARFRILLIDLPGHGHAAQVPGPYGTAAFAAAIEAALAAARIDRTHFWGTHSGASAGLLLACRQPALFASLVLEAPVFPGRAMPSVADMLSRTAQVLESQGLAAARRLWWEEADWFQVMRAEPGPCRAAEHRAMIENFNGRPWLEPEAASAVTAIDDALARLNVPVLIVNGERDLMDFLDAAAALSTLLPNCRRASISGGGGFPFWEFPGKVNPVVDDFLTGLARLDPEP